ncbi:cytochrome c [Komagataeibacter sp. FNDCR2]|uniref:c-type cytochrome n=1 Tax=Komagataeibacter sp. FNDCR2 TaxID=2878682 RepID=UPI001E33FB69|nr:cytochrome c [Komagataeibacter sp. FNDCR2]MCE2576576.1 cytochrome c [Komagataeibacter sp. FNDCR2]
MKPARPARFVSFALLLLATGCDDMSKQHKENPYASADSAPAEPVPGTVEYHDAPHPVPRLTMGLLQRGRDEYHAFCAPCHAETGNGDGMVVQRGFPAPLPLMAAGGQTGGPMHLHDVITSGQGIMYGFAQRIGSDDRWAIVAYLYALGRSQHATRADMTPEQLARAP